MPQSINYIDPNYYQEKYDKDLIDMAHKENLWSRFMLGEKMNIDKFLHTSLMQEKVCVDSCSMYDYLWNAIKGELKEDCPKRHEGFFKVQQVYEQVFKPEESCDAIEECTPVIEW